jgi:RNA polymerase sigma factor (sigma-70 family)
MAPGTLNDVLRQLRKLCQGEADRDLGDGDLLERFLARREETAFAILVQRHGPMVLGVCQRVLKDPHAAEDAFQASFLVLARRSATIRKRGSLASWLYGVAQRIALRARARGAAQRSRERRSGEMPRAEALDELTWQELRSVLDEEIGSLPERYRAPVVLCYLEGKSYEQAARELGWPKSSLASRLSRARGVLRERLARRGVALSAAALAAGLAERAAGAALPALLVLNTVKGVTLFAAGKAAAGPLSAQALALGEESMKGMLGFKGKALIALLVAGLGAGLAGLAGHAAPGREPPTPPGDARGPAAGVDQSGAAKADAAGGADRPAAPAAKPQPAPAQPADQAGETFTYAGRVLGPDGKPLAGAKLFINGLTPGVIEYRARGTSGPDGTFRFRVRRDEFGDKGVVPPSRSPPERYVHIGASAEGCGAASVWAGQAEEREQLTLWLPAEEIVTGRVMDLEGRPVAGVDVHAYIRGSRAAKDHRPLPYDAPSTAGHFSGNILPQEDRNSGKTDKDGRFTLRGLSHGWLYDLSFHGPTIVNAKACLAARPQKAGVMGGAGISPPDRPLPQMPLYGSTFTHVAVPCKPILGVVREKGSGKPLAGVGVSREWTRDDDPQGWATTDKEGRYKLTGLPPGVHTLRVDPPRGTPYLTAEFRVQADQPGIEPVTFDIQLERQPAASGRVIDRATGKPVQAWVEYRPLAKNPNLKANAFLAEARWRNHPPSDRTDADGRFMLPVLRGPGVVLVRAEHEYLPTSLAKEDRVAGVADPADPELIDCRPLLAWPREFHAYRLIDVPEGKDAAVEIALTPGLSRPLVLEFPDGKARETTVLGLKPVSNDRGEVYFPGRSAVHALAEGEVRRLIVSTQDAQLAASAVVSGKEAGPVTVKLKPTGTITGRVVDKDGKPIAGVSFQTLCDGGPGWAGVFVHGGSIIPTLTPAESRRKPRTSGFYDQGLHVSRSEQTDAEGRFRLPGILADVAFDLKVRLVAPPNAKGQRFITGEVIIARPTVKPGETLDLGDLRAVAPPKKK